MSVAILSFYPTKISRVFQFLQSRSNGVSSIRWIFCDSFARKIPVIWLTVYVCIQTLCLPRKAGIIDYGVWYHRKPFGYSYFHKMFLIIDKSFSRISAVLWECISVWHPRHTAIKLFGSFKRLPRLHSTWWNSTAVHPHTSQGIHSHGILPRTLQAISLYRMTTFSLAYCDSKKQSYDCISFHHAWCHAIVVE